MSTIVTRAGKGSPLEFAEVDSNFTNLNTDKYQSGGALGTPASGTLTNCTGLPNGGLVNSSITINGTAVSLGGTVTTPQGTVTSVTGTSPIVSSGGTTPAISMPAATTSANGYLTSTDWNTFNSKGSGTVTSVAATAGTGISVSGSPITSSGTLNIVNTAPDQVVSLTAGSNVTITGTYPSFTIASSGGGSMVYPSGTGIAVVTSGTSWGTTLTAPSGTIVGTSDTQTLTNKTLTGFTETVYEVIDAEGVALSPTNGTIQTWTLGANRTPTAGTWNSGQSMTLMISDNAAYTVTWTTLGVVWVGGSAPALATTGFTVIELWEVGTTIYGAFVGNVA
jgi:hypothetical protein